LVLEILKKLILSLQYL